MGSDVTKFIRKIDFQPAWDKRDPDPRKNCGVHGADMHMSVTNEKGTIHLRVFTGWQLPHVREAHRYFHYMASGLYYHSPESLNKAWEKPPESGRCDFIGVPCFSGEAGNSSRAEQVFETLIAEGSDTVWELLEEIHAETFKEAPWDTQ